MARFSALMERRTPRARALVTVVAAMAVAAVLLVGIRAALTLDRRSFNMSQG